MVEFSIMPSTTPTSGVPSEHQKKQETTQKSRSKYKENAILWLGLIPILILVPWWTTRLHYRLPQPKVELFDKFGRPQISEARILEHVTQLTDPHKIGFRTVGTREHALGDAWAVEQVKSLTQLCNDVKANALKEGRKVDLHCEWDRQQGSGTHKFDLMNRLIYKSYQNLTNVLFRISSSSEESRSLAILLNAHLDSTLPSPGAADDALAVGICLEIGRVLVEMAGKGLWEPGWSIILLLNNAEESLQDASHLFSTQHPWAQTVRTVVNLEAAGSKGPELLFQATSEDMVEVYREVPHPYGTVLANDVFASGIMMSDTDFRQFDQYLSVPGIDLAVVGHSYFYHTSKDTVEHIEPGVAQHFAENVLEITKRMTERPKNRNGTYTGESRLQRVQKFDETPQSSTHRMDAEEFPEKKAPVIAKAPSSGLSNSSPFASAEMGGQQHSRRPDVVFYSLFGMGVVLYSGTTARLLYTLWALICVSMVWIGKHKHLKMIPEVIPKDSKINNPKSASKAKQSNLPITTSTKPPVYSHVSILARSMAFLLFTLVKGIVYANGAAFLMRSVIGRSLTWFAGEWRPVGLYMWPALTAFLARPPKALVHPSVSAPTMERTLLHASLLLNSILAVVVQTLGIGSAIVFFLNSLGVGLGLMAGLVIEFMNGTLGSGEPVPIITYLIGSILPLSMGVELAVGSLDVFVPLTGRMPPFVPSEHIIATPIPVFIFNALPLLLPAAYRLPQATPEFQLGTITRSTIRWSLRIASVSAIVWYAFLSGWGSWPYDAMHPKRVFISLSQQLNSGEYGLHIAAMDGAPHFDVLLNRLAGVVTNYGASINAENVTTVVPIKTQFDIWNTDWNTFYPLGDLLDHYSLSTAPSIQSALISTNDQVGLEINIVKEEIDRQAGTRSLTLELKHENAIWTVLAFDAHVVSWSIDDSPPDYYARHHIKEASFYGTDTWTIEMTVLLNPDRTTQPGSPTSQEGKLEFSFSGLLEKSVWPAKKWEWEKEKARNAELGEGYHNVAMDLFEKIANWADTETEGSVDIFMMHNVMKQFSV